MASVEEIYTKLTQLEHVLQEPDTYVSSVEHMEMLTYVYDEESDSMVERTINIVPAFYKIFDEILVNAFDQFTRLNYGKSKNPVTTIKVAIDREKNRISVYNDGEGIPVEMHSETEMYVPEMIFSEFLTSGNYNNRKERITGGKNGFGGKLTNAFSLWFKVETSDGKKSYSQIFKNNLSERTKAKIGSVKDKKKTFTRITYDTDLERFGMDRIDDDSYAIICKRVFDIAGVGGSALKVFLNGKRILSGKSKTKTPFQKYVDMYLTENERKSTVYFAPHDRWELCVVLSEEGEFKQTSFVNGLATIKGGKHVDHVSDAITRNCIKFLKGKKKFESVKAPHIKKNMRLFLRSTITSPTFDSQIKEFLTTKVASFGSRFPLTLPKDKKSGKDYKFIADVVKKTGIVERALSLCEYKDKLALGKTSGKKARRVLHPKLEDAFKAGTKESLDCTLILTEGDSAKAAVMAGINIIGREYYGVLPLKGKLLNTRGATKQKIAKNKEIADIVKIMGLEYGKKYKTPEDLKSLRYGSITVLTDQDVDGDHIKGLVINFVHSQWKELIEIPGFVRTIYTPVVKYTSGSKVKEFYSDVKSDKWYESLSESEQRRWTKKYYKGLGTSTAEEFKAIFKNLDKHLCRYVSLDEKSTNKEIEKAFNEKKADDRKDWLSLYDPMNVVDASRSELSYPEFVNEGLKHFSTYDNHRSLPSMVDGLKPCQRKVLYGTIKKNIKKEIKVGQLANSVAEITSYHHGEMSLVTTIIGMARDFVGSNNINLLEPRGQFGTRTTGGKDHASERYIFTALMPITRLIFHPEDDPLLNNLYEDGSMIEPEFFIPVIPMGLINGTSGIGTGYSTNVPCYNPRDVIKNIIRMLDGKEPKNLKPWYRNFDGDIEKDKGNKYLTKGLLERKNNTTVVISEAPIGTWTEKLKVHYESLIVDSKVKKSFLTDVKNMSSDVGVSFILKAQKGVWDKKFKDVEALMMELKLYSSVSVSNMHMFNKDNVITKYKPDLKEYFQEFYAIRLATYVRRREYLLAKLRRERDMNAFKAKFLKQYMADEITINKVEEDDVIAQLEEYEYPKFAPAMTVLGEEDGKLSYEYLLNMTIRSLTKKRLAELIKKRDMRQAEYDALEEMTPEQIWRDDLNAISSHLDAIKY